MEMLLVKAAFFAKIRDYNRRYKIMNDMQKEGVQERLPQFCAPIFPKCDSIDRLFAVIYLLVGYAFIYACSSYTFEQNLALFTVFYGAVVLAYLWGKEIRPSKESWFWLGVMLSIGVPYAFWSTVHLRFQC